MTALSHYRNRPRPRRGTRTEAAAVLADLKRLARPVCEECGRPARDRFATLALCETHTAEAMAAAYAMETGGAY